MFVRRPDAQLDYPTRIGAGRARICECSRRSLSASRTNSGNSASRNPNVVTARLETPAAARRQTADQARPRYCARYAGWATRSTRRRTRPANQLVEEEGPGPNDCLADVRLCATGSFPDQFILDRPEEPGQVWPGHLLGRREATDGLIRCSLDAEDRNFTHGRAIHREVDTVPGGMSFAELLATPSSVIDSSVLVTLPEASSPDFTHGTGPPKYSVRERLGVPPLVVGT